MAKRKGASRPVRKADGARPDTERAVRVAAQLRQELARLVGRDLADPRLEGVVIASVWMSADLRLAKAYFRLATTDEGAALHARRAAAEAALEKASGRLRKAATSRLGLRVAPELRFLYDEGQDARGRIEHVLAEIERERLASGDDGGDGGDGGSDTR